MRAQSFITPGLLSLVGYSSETSNLINAVICIVIAFVSTFVLTFLLGFKEPDKETVRELTGAPISEEEKKEIEEKAEAIEATAREAGEAAGDAAMEVTRATIASGATNLGKATGLVPPEEGKAAEEEDKGDS